MKDEIMDKNNTIFRYVISFLEMKNNEHLIINCYKFYIYLVHK